jgi:DNA-directed RNA polymerase subunit RPC12/RpoP
MDNYNKKMENMLIDMVKQKEENDKILLKLEIVIGILSILILLVPIFIGALLPMEDWQRLLIVFSGFIPAFVGFMFSVKIEQMAGYYECPHCGYRYVPTYKAVNLAPHLARTRRMACPSCGKKGWQKKVISKDPGDKQ